MKVRKWFSILEKKPDKDGVYYVLVSNCMDNSNEIIKCEFKNNQWMKIGGRFSRIIAWKNIKEKNIENEDEWLKNHITEIRKAFHNNDINSSDCSIAETLDECICDYEWFLWSDHVRYIDSVFVIRIL